MCQDGVVIVAEEEAERRLGKEEEGESDKR